MPSDKVIHHLETWIPLIVDEYPGGEDLPTSKSQSDNDPPFDSVVFMYGMFAGVVAPLSTFAFHLLIRGDAASMANILEDSTKMTYWSRVVGGGITFISTTYYFLTLLLFVKLLRLSFLDRNPRSSGQKDKEEEENEDNHMISTLLGLTFALGSLVSVDTNSYSNK
jgi:hypothetical protein